MNTACMYLFEALSKHLLSSYPRLRSLRSFSLGLLRVSLRGYKSLLRLEDGDKPHPYIGGTSLHHHRLHPLCGKQWNPM